MEMKRKKNKVDDVTSPKASRDPANKDSDVGTIVSIFMSSNTTLNNGEGRIRHLVPD